MNRRALALALGLALSLSAQAEVAEMPDTLAAPAATTAAPAASPDKTDVGAKRSGLPQGSDGVSDVTQLRLEAIREAVAAWAVQDEVARQSERNRQDLLARAGELDQIFDFAALTLYDGRVTPPIVVEANNAFELKDARTATGSVSVFRLAQPARIVAQAPSWRDYLIKPTATPKPVASVLRPNTPGERAAWDETEQEARRWGQLQAKALLDAAMARLERDYLGMARARRLIQQQILAMPVLAEGREGVRIEGDDLIVGSLLMRITQDSKYNRSEQWKPLPSFSRTNR